MGAHFIADCKSVKRCSICKQKHHTSLHIKGYKNNNENSNKRNNTNNPSTSKEVTGTETVALSTNSWQLLNQPLLATAIVNISSNNGLNF